MWSDSAAATHAERDTLQRRFPRQILRTMTYVTLDDAGAATLHDLSLGGCALQSASPVPEDGPVRLRFELGTPRVRIDAVGKVVWTHASGIAGVQFVELPVKAEKQLKEWMLSSVLLIVFRCALISYSCSLRTLPKVAFSPDSSVKSSCSAKSS